MRIWGSCRRFCILRSRIDHVLLIGFGGPTKPEEIQPFLEVVTQGARIPPQRLREVARHYEATGGFSPYNRHAARLSEKLQQALHAAGLNLPVFLGMRNWRPFLSEVLAQIKGKGLRHGIGIVLAPHRCEAGFNRYVRSLEQARAEVSGADLFYELLGPWYDHFLFLEAQADQARRFWRPMSSMEKAATHLLFTAHSIPVEMAGRSRYEEEIRTSSHGVAQLLACSNWSIAFQSRSGPPTQPWLEPEARAVIPSLKGKGIRNLLVVPIGFLFDHTEVLYDLDVDLKETALASGLSYRRASTVMDHPQFVEMLTELVREKMEPE